MTRPHKMLTFQAAALVASALMMSTVSVMTKAAVAPPVAAVQIANFTDVNTPTAGVAFGDNVAKWNLAWALHAGVAYKVSPNFTVELAYRYLDMGDGLTGDLRAFDGTNAIYNPTTFKHITSHDLKLGVRWDLTSPAVYAPPPLIRKG